MMQNSVLGANDGVSKINRAIISFRVVLNPKASSRSALVVDEAGVGNVERSFADNTITRRLVKNWLPQKKITTPRAANKKKISHRKPIVLVGIIVTAKNVGR